MQESLDEKEVDLTELRQAVDSAKNTILSQNRHIADQDLIVRQLRQKYVDKQKESKPKIENLQNQNALFCSQVDR